ncbi:hypothetical protein EDB85DRAFT_632601 [Lactarius pseudohatsudake]|nr:hypothetical protein EDB85DRAFT_632601 [Lactarius pseudohatsudake]
MVRKHSLISLSFILFFTFLLPSVVLGNKWEATSFCKGICFGTKNAILRLDIPDNPSKPCLSSSGKEGDVEARCFQRDSPRDQLVVTLFLLTVFGLLLGAGIKGRMLKAGIDTSLPWDAGRKWWQALVPRRFDDIGMRVRLPNSTRARGDYVVISNGGGDGS